MQNYSPNLKYVLSFLIAIVFSSSCTTDKPSVDEGPLVVTSRLRAEPDRLNPMLTARGWALQAANHIFPTLLEYNPKTLKLSPKLAKSLPTVENITEGPYAGGVAFTFEILEEAVWDNGKPVLASDYVFTLKALFNPKLTIGAPIYRHYLDMIKDVKLDATNPRKFTVLTDRVYIRSQYACGFYVIPEYIYDSKGLLKDIALADLTNSEKASELAANEPKLQEFADEFTSDKNSRQPEGLISCGAYRLEEWVPGERVVLTKKKDWWGDKLSAKQPLLTAGPDQIIYKPIPDATTAISLLMDQSLDVINFVPNTQFVELQKNELVTEHYNLYTPNSPVYNYYGINTNKPTLNDKRVRWALAHLLDVKEIIKSIKYGMAIPIASPIPPTFDYYNKDLKPVPLDIEKARQLLAEAGWADSNGNGIVDKVVDGERVELSISILITPRNEDSKNMCLIFQETAKKAGVEIVITPKEANVFREDRNSGNYDLYAAGAAPDPSLYDFYQTWHTNSAHPNGSNYFGFGDAESNALIEEIRRTVDKPTRDALYMKMQKMIYDEMPVLFIYNAQDRVVISKRLKNSTPTETYPSVYENYFTK